MSDYNICAPVGTAFQPQRCVERLATCPPKWLAELRRAGAAAGSCTPGRSAAGQSRRVEDDLVQLVIGSRWWAGHRRRQGVGRKERASKCRLATLRRGNSPLLSGWKKPCSCRQKWWRQMSTAACRRAPAASESPATLDRGARCEPSPAGQGRQPCPAGASDRPELPEARPEWLTHWARSRPLNVDHLHVCVHLLGQLSNKGAFTGQR
jgi:hypothetical protein